MKEEEVFRELKAVGCCSGCCARFIGLRNPASYANLDILPSKYMGSSVGDSSNTNKSTLVEEKEKADNTPSQSTNGGGDTSHGNGLANNGSANGDGDDEEQSASKRFKWAVCVCCVGVLQKQTWLEAINQVVDSLHKRNYESDTFACALSSPACISLREKSLQYHLQNKIPDYKIQTITPLKEAWKWSFGEALAAAISKTLDSGAVCPLLITINYDYERDQEELDTLRDMAPDNRVVSRLLQRPETTRRCVTDVLQSSSADVVRDKFGVPPPDLQSPARAMSVRVTHAPVYLAGRYIKLSRQLSQTPWLIDGEKMMESSVQDIIFAPIAKFYSITGSDCESRLKLVGAGREDVDVRCLGTGRPFAVEVSDPHRTPSQENLIDICDEINRGGDIIVKTLRIVSRDDMTLLKKGEEFKEKSYRALCIKLPKDIENLSSKANGDSTEFTDEDIDKINSYTNSDESCRVKIEQKTPIRVLHRRPLLTRQRKILAMEAAKVPGHGNLFTVDLRTEAGTYVKEFVHGDLGRTRPCLRDILNANVDILALDVTQVHLDW